MSNIELKIDSITYEIFLDISNSCKTKFTNLLYSHLNLLTLKDRKIDGGCNIKFFEGRFYTLI